MSPPYNGDCALTHGLHTAYAFPLCWDCSLPYSPMRLNSISVTVSRCSEMAGPYAPDELVSINVLGRSYSGFKYESTPADWVCSHFKLWAALTCCGLIWPNAISQPARTSFDSFFCHVDESESGSSTADFVYSLIVELVEKDGNFLGHCMFSFR